MITRKPLWLRKDFLSCKFGGEHHVHLIRRRRLICNLLWGLCAEEWSSCFEDYRCATASGDNPHNSGRASRDRPRPSVGRWRWLLSYRPLLFFFLFVFLRKRWQEVQKIDVLIDFAQSATAVEFVLQEFRLVTKCWFVQWAADDFHCRLIFRNDFMGRNTFLHSMKESMSKFYFFLFVPNFFALCCSLI